MFCPSCKLICQNICLQIDKMICLQIDLSTNRQNDLSKYLSTNLTKLICVFSKKFKHAQTIAKYRTNIAQKPHPRF